MQRIFIIIFFPAEFRAKVLNLRWITMHHSSARLWKKQNAVNVCHRGRRSRCWWTDRRCCAPCTTLAPGPANSTSAHTPLPMRFGTFLRLFRFLHVFLFKIQKSPDNCKLFFHLSLSSNLPQVVRRMQEKLGLQDSKNTFALYEQNALWEQPVPGNSLIADVLTRYEKDSHFSILQVHKSST